MRGAQADLKNPHRVIGADLDKLPDWSGECVAIVAAGPTGKQYNYDLIRNRMRVVAINTSYELVPWADMLYACDVDWWRVHRGAPDFKGIKVTQDAMACTMFPGQLVRIEVISPEIRWQVYDDRLKFARFGDVASGGNGAFHAFNLVAQMGAAAIALIAVDLIGEHWHGRHPPPCTNPHEQVFPRWRKAFDDAAPVLAQRGVDVVNCSQISTVKAYPKISIEEMLERWGL